MMSSHWMI